MNAFTNAVSESKLDVAETEKMMKGVRDIYQGVDKAVLAEFVETGAAIFATGVQMLVANYCVTDLTQPGNKASWKRQI